jgi:hypothetical protein
MPWENFSAPLVIDSSLLSTIAAAASIAFIHNPNRFGVLPFLVLDDKFQAFVIRVDRQLGTTAILSRITEQPVEPVVTACLHLQDQVAKVDYIILVSAAHSGSIQTSAFNLPAERKSVSQEIQTARPPDPAIFCIPHSPPRARLNSIRLAQRKPPHLSSAVPCVFG